MKDETGNKNENITECQSDGCQSVIDTDYTAEDLILFENCPLKDKDVYLCPECYKEKEDEIPERNMCETHQDQSMQDFIDELD